jgi:hypothetical protein
MLSIVNPANYKLVSVEALWVTLQINCFNWLILRELQVYSNLITFLKGPILLFISN